MIRSNQPGQYFLACGMAAFGLLNLVYGGFALQWQPLAGIAFEPALARACGVVLLLAALGQFVPRIAAGAALAQAGCFFLFFWLPELMGLRHAALNVGSLLPLAEDSAILCGALLAARGAFKPRFRDAGYSSPTRLLIPGSQAAFGLACLVFGLSHYAYADFTAAMVPPFLPGRLALAYLTGTAHILAGLAILTRILARVAATLEAVMMSLFVLLVHMPMLAAPTDPAGARLAWTMLAAALSLSAAAWTIAGSFARERRTTEPIAPSFSAGPTLPGPPLQG